MLGKDDPQNVANRMREGWQPRKADTVKGFDVPTINHGQFDGYIGVEGMILCEAPKEMVDKRNEYYRNKARTQELAVDAAVKKVADSGGIPIEIEKNSTVDHGRKQPPLMDD